MLIAFAVSLIAGHFLIPALTRHKAAQTEREELVSHQKKAGTPTMGGIMILLGYLVSALLFGWNRPRILLVLFLSIAFGLIGFLDDFLKVIMHRSDGLYPKQKMALQIVVTAVFAAALYFMKGGFPLLRIPFSGGFLLDIGFFSIILLFIAVIGTVNGTNFTDGIDGLASSVTVIVACFFLAASMLTDSGIEPLCGAMIGALLGFLVYNCYPARIFMGDTGSLALGGFVAGCAYIMDMPIYIVIVGLVYLVEVVSVMIQVVYFKKTGGKRFFRMAPIHHHFELGGWSETQVVFIFTIVTVLLCLVGILAI